MNRINFFRILFFLLALHSFGVDAKQNFDAVATIENAVAYHQQNVHIKAIGKIEKILPDDTKGSRHQKMIVRVNAKLTILIAHNIDIAKRIPDVKEGDSLEFYGEYEWNPKGGVVHWTHHDPRGKHPAGWLKHNGITYQ